MAYVSRLMIVALIGAVAVSGCGKKKSAIKDEGSAAKNIVQQDVLTDEETPFREMIETAGFEITAFKKFPAQEQGVKGRVLIYHGKKNDASGILFLKKIGSTVSPAWHWYFNDVVVDSVDAVESNEDGLWDVRITDSRNRAQTFIQEETFTLAANPREDFLALNGTSVPPAIPGHALWMMFDGKTETSWQTSLDGKAGAVLEFNVPFGVVEGTLAIETSAENQPKECDVYAGGQKIDSLKFEKKSGRQLFKLAESIKGATEIRIVFSASYEKDGMVSVAELALK